MLFHHQMQMQLDALQLDAFLVWSTIYRAAVQRPS